MKDRNPNEQKPEFYQLLDELKQIMGVAFFPSRDDGGLALLLNSFSNQNKALVDFLNFFRDVLKPQTIALNLIFGRRGEQLKNGDSLYLNFIPLIVLILHEEIGRKTPIQDFIKTVGHIRTYIEERACQLKKDPMGQWVFAYNETYALNPYLSEANQRTGDHTFLTTTCSIDDRDAYNTIAWGALDLSVAFDNPPFLSDNGGEYTYTEEFSISDKEVEGLQKRILANPSLYKGGFNIYKTFKIKLTLGDTNLSLLTIAFSEDLERCVLLHGHFQTRENTDQFYGYLNKLLHKCSEAKTLLERLPYLAELHYCIQLALPLTRGSPTFAHALISAIQLSHGEIPSPPTKDICFHALTSRFDGHYIDDFNRILMGAGTPVKSKRHPDFFTQLCLSCRHIDDENTLTDIWMKCLDNLDRNGSFPSKRAVIFFDEVTKKMSDAAWKSVDFKKFLDLESHYVLFLMHKLVMCAPSGLEIMLQRLGDKERYDCIMIKDIYGNSSLKLSVRELPATKKSFEILVKMIPNEKLSEAFQTLGETTKPLQWLMRDPDDTAAKIVLEILQAHRRMDVIRGIKIHGVSLAKFADSSPSTHCTAQQRHAMQ